MGQFGAIKENREIVGSIYPENLIFNGEYYQTNRLNEAVRQIYLIESELQEKKNDTSKVNVDLCRKAERGIASAHPFSFVASTPYLIAVSSISMFISFKVLNLMQYPVTLALPSFFPYVWFKYVLSFIPMM